MKIIVDEAFLNEFIGADLNIISGREKPIKTDVVFTNTKKGGKNPPQSADEFAKQARVPWWSGYLTGGSQGTGIPSQGTIFEQESKGGVEDLKDLFNDVALYSTLMELKEQIGHIYKDFDNPKDIETIKVIVATEVLRMMDINSMGEDSKKRILSAI